MHNIKEHIVFKILTFLLVLTLLAPSAIKLAHVFEHHEHEVCIGNETTHIHKVDLDCEFQKFNINTHYLFTSNYAELFETVLYNNAQLLTYKFLNNHRPLSFSLRGPPVLV